ncbi:hypothetical protein KXD40_008410 [Peronospora effusa]|uniref:Uncharacterized protein n=1 Tax=Peronospora effusa TaxID=542832 RepID=A0A3M6VTC4_9STRA|nr:hypothetical protein DD238_003990 [Peronospora effusa]UIZ24400.1 hypothetical protein KXD40_008410 [Peronospora effusa]
MGKNQKEGVQLLNPRLHLKYRENYGDQATLSNIYVKTTDGDDDVKVTRKQDAFKSRRWSVGYAVQ